MASGEHHAEQRPEHHPDSQLPSGEQLAPGVAMVGVGRISAARRNTSVLGALPFTRSQLARLDRTLEEATAATGLHVSVYLGDLGRHPRDRAHELVDSLGDDAADAVLVAVSPGQRRIEVVIGAAAHKRIPDRVCSRAVTAMVAMFGQGELAEGLLVGLRILSERTVP